MTRIEHLLAEDTAGDPITGLRWSRRTTAKIAEQLTQQGFTISPNTVARLLYQMDYRLRGNRKQIATATSPDRNGQFEYIADLRESLSTPALADHQCRYQEAGIGRSLQERRRALGAGRPRRQRP